MLIMTVVLFAYRLNYYWYLNEYYWLKVSSITKDLICESIFKENIQGHYFLLLFHNYKFYILIGPFRLIQSFYEKRTVK